MFINNPKIYLLYKVYKNKKQKFINLQLCLTINVSVFYLNYIFSSYSKIIQKLAQLMSMFKLSKNIGNYV